MIDEKFFDYFIVQSEEVMEGKSVYWVAQSKTSNKLIYINSSIVKTVEWSKNTVINLSMEANQYSTIILHSFFFPYLNLFLRKLRKDIKVMWMFWGGDGYCFTTNEKQWYQPLTWEYKRGILNRNAGIIRTVSRKIDNFYSRFVRSHLTRRLIRKIDTCITWVRYDYEMIRHINPAMKWLHYSYFTTEQMGLYNVDLQKLDLNRIWLGNSATDTNNHFDALDYLKRIDWQGEIVVPLSYGSKAYAEDVIKYGVYNFGERFISLTTFMTLDQYHECMNSCGIIWMNHNRQQAAGNVVAALYMEKVVIMNPDNNLCKTLKEWNIFFAKQEDLKNATQVKSDALNRNRDIIISHFSRKESLADLHKIFCR
ncbi:MAG: hypothetical protein BGP13_05450 [Sphingobacteriales bacterium 40-81]|nr:MAG: hypothetical protein BGP13_05450 [Sphingobacteriales bacterium 40-81]